MRIAHLLIALTACSRIAHAQTPLGSELLIPLGSFFVPGLGQYVYHAPGVGAAYTATAIGGVALGLTRDVPDTLEFPRAGRDQLSSFGWDVSMNAGWLSSWDAFHRAVPALKRQGKYTFLPERESLPHLLSAPFDMRFLRRWTTWVDLTQTAVITTLVLSERRSGEQYLPFRGRDGAFAASLAENAATGEEAWFRGYLLPVLHEHLGHRFWAANATQAGIFAAGHLPPNAGSAIFLAGWATWEGWIVRRNDWSVRESIFHHFWFDFAVSTAAALTEKKAHAVQIRVPTIRF